MNSQTLPRFGTEEPSAPWIEQENKTSGSSGAFVASLIEPVDDQIWTTLSILAYRRSVSRPKEFDREVVLETAQAVFWRKGYKATSTEDLRLAMGIGRQSFYDTFGGKRQIYIEVLQRYNSDGIQACIAKLRTASS